MTNRDLLFLAPGEDPDDYRARVVAQGHWNDVLLAIEAGHISRAQVVSEVERLAGERGGEAVAWQVSDFADGWITFIVEANALAYVAETGALMRPLYAAPQPLPVEVEREQLVEPVARAMCVDLGVNPDDWHEEDGGRVYAWQKEADTAAAAIQAMRDCGALSPPSPDAEALAGRLEEDAAFLEASNSTPFRWIGSDDDYYIRYNGDASRDFLKAAALIRGSGR